MRIAAVSDIHTRPKGLDKDLLQAISDRVTSLNPDVFVIAGDMNEELHELRESLSAIHADCCPNLFVAGNHDIWFEEERGYGTLEKYSDLINKACRDSGFIHLPNDFFVLDKTAFIGSLGWYDYSFRRLDLDIPIQSYETKHFREMFWRDYYCVDWPLTDREATAFLNKKLEYDLKSLPEDVEQVVYVSHHLPFQALTHYKDKLPWDFFSAFMGSESTGDVLKQDERVILAISGHSHFRSVVSLDRITAVTVPLGYCRPQTDELDEFVEKLVAEMEIAGNQVRVQNFFGGDLCEGLPYQF